MINKLIVGIALLVGTISGYAQPTPLVQGQIVDIRTGQPLPYATLTVADGQISSETNKDGYFMFALPNPFLHDTLTISAISYPLTQVPLLPLASTDTIIRLQALPVLDTTSATNIYFSLQPPFQARDTLLKAVAAIARNYSHKPSRLHGFYRETIHQQQPDLCVFYGEGSIDIDKPPYGLTRQNDQIRFIKGRRAPLAAFKIPVLTPGPWANNMLDIVKYQEFLFRKGKLNPAYIFALTSQAVIGGQPVYVITFKPRNYHAISGYYQGKLFVATSDLAIIRAEYELAPQGLSLLNRSRNAQIYSTQWQQRTYRVDYTVFDGYWSLQSGSIENTFVYGATGHPFQSRIDLVITTRQSAPVTSFRADQPANYTQMAQPLFSKTTSDFWNGETYLVPIRPLPTLITGFKTP